MYELAGAGFNDILFNTQTANQALRYWGKVLEYMRGNVKLDQLPKSLRSSSFAIRTLIDNYALDLQPILKTMNVKDDIIKTAGEKVSPKEIENVLYEIEDILEAGVIGVSDELLGQAIKAVVALKIGSALNEKNIIQYCSKHLENFMVPKYVEIRQQLPKTSTGKIRKKDLVQTT